MNKMLRPAARLRDLAPDLAVSERLESLVAALLAQTAEERPSASMLLRELEACRRELDATPPPRSAPEAPRAAAATAAMGRPTSRSDMPSAPALCARTMTPAPSATDAIGERLARLARLTPYVVAVLVLYGLGLVYGFLRSDSLLHDQVPVVRPAPAAAASGAPVSVNVRAPREDERVVVAPLPAIPRPAPSKPAALAPRPAESPERAPVPPMSPRAQIFSTE